LAAVEDRALFTRLPRLADLVPFVALADGLPTPTEQVGECLWVKRDDATAAPYGGNKVRKFEFVLPIAVRRGGPVVTAGGIGSHHVVAAAEYCMRLGLEVEAVLYPQDVTDDVSRTQARVAQLGVRVTEVANRYLMPIALAQRLAALAPRKPYLLWPGASTPLGTLGYVSAGLELVADVDEPDAVVVALGSGGTAVGLALGIAMGGWHRARVVAVRAADPIVTSAPVLRGLEAGTAALLAMGGSVPKQARLEIDGRWFGGAYGRPTAAGASASEWAGTLGIAAEPTYTAKALAAARELVDDGQRVIFVQTFAG
jgi:D-cysteine desulfhydrase